MLRIFIGVFSALLLVSILHPFWFRCCFLCILFGFLSASFWCLLCILSGIFSTSILLYSASFLVSCLHPFRCLIYILLGSFSASFFVSFLPFYWCCWCSICVLLGVFDIQQKWNTQLALAQYFDFFLRKPNWFWTRK